MKKKLFTLLLCAFAVLGVKAALPTGLNVTITDGTLTINSTTAGLLKQAIEDSDNASLLQQIKNSNPTKIVLIGEFSNDDFNKSRDAEVGVGSVTEIDCSSADFNGSTYTFEHWKTTLTKVSLPTGVNDTAIPSTAFQNCTLVTEVDIPANIEEIQAQAFTGSGITKVVIPSTLKYVRTGAFTNCTTIQEVIVPATWVENGTTYPVCEMNAFDFNTLVSQTVIGDGAAKRATLKFNEADFNYYCGDWKRRLAFTQKNLNDIKDGYHNEQGTLLGPNNGWQQFAETGSPTEQVIPKGKFVRTFSTDVPYVLPKYTYQDTNNGGAYVTADLLRIYRASSYDKGSNAVTLTEIESVIPENTGVIMRSIELNDYDALVFMVEATRPKYNWSTYSWSRTGENANFLETSIRPTEIGPVTYDESGKKKLYRNFGLYEIDKENVVYEFIRYSKGTIRENRAYLKLPVDLFTNSNEGEHEGPGSGISDDSSSAKLSLVFLDDIEDSNETTGIQTINIRQNDNTYYNLQGMKVENPSKGIFIFNGKKVIK